jgi:penicillin G amidase
MKKLLLGSAILVSAGVVLALAGLAYLRSAEPSYSGERPLPGLSARVEVLRDSLGVPHIHARDERDLVRALGYLHARERLWQMELFRLTAEGRLAEVLGRDVVPADRFLRTVGFGRAAEANLAVLGAEEREILEAYAEGVNAWIDGRTRALPPEMVILRHRPERWLPRHSLGISKLMAWDLASFAAGLDLQRAIDAVGPELGRDLLPHYPEWAEVILGAEAAWKTTGKDAPACCSGERRLAVSAAPIPGIPAAAIPFLEAASVARASNSWVVSGALTHSGKPILANDPHLAYRSPGLWYAASLSGGRIRAAGVTIPGIPAVILGRTPAVAWAWTNAMVEDVDFFVEQLDSAGTRYRTPDGWREIETREETIRVKGSESLVHTVRSTRNGPLISDVEPRSGARVLAMRWTALEPTTELAALLAVYRAGNAEEFDRAIRGVNNVHQNVLFADTAGRIGYRMVGRVPVRRSGDGLLPVPGWTGEGDWLRYLEPEELPALMDPLEGFIATANDRQLGPEYPFVISPTWAAPYRGMRIRQMLRDSDALTARETSRQQMDVLDLHALRYRGHAVRAAERAGETEAAAALTSWSGHAHADSRAAALFYTWYERLRRRIAADEFGDRPMYFPRSSLDRILDEGTSRWIDDVRTDTVETLEGLSALAMLDAVETVGRSTWGDLHELRMDHALAGVRPLAWILGLNVGRGPIGGSSHTVDVAGFGSEGPPFVTAHGASMRQVVDLADPDGSGGLITPTGQSGIPSSRHYRDQHALWRDGRLWLLPLEPSRQESRARTRMILTPG